MIDLQRFHHTGMIVADIDQAQIDIGNALGLTWAPVRDFSPFAFWTPEDGTHELQVRATYSLGGPHRLELVQGTGPVFDPHAAPDARHIGLFVDDIAAEAHQLLTLGWHVVGSNAAPDDGFGIIAYMAPPLPGLLVELISMDLKPLLDEWLGD